MKSWRRSSSLSHFFCLGEEGSASGGYRTCRLFKRLQKRPDCWVGAVDKTAEAVVPSLCNVGAPGQTAKGSIPLVPGHLTEERRVGRGPQTGVLQVVSEVTHLSRKGRMNEPPHHVNVTAGKTVEGSDHLEGLPHSRSIDLVLSGSSIL